MNNHTHKISAKETELLTSNLEAMIIRLLEHMSGFAQPRELLLHLPQPLLRALSKKSNPIPEFRSGRVYICQPPRRKGGKVSVRELGLLPSRSALRQQLLLVAVDQNDRLVANLTPTGGSNRVRSDLQRWVGTLSYAPDKLPALLEDIRRKASGDSATIVKLRRWIEQRSKASKASAVAGKAENAGSAWLLDAAWIAAQIHRQRSSRLDYLEVLNAVQGAVAWELNAGKFFGALSDVLKSSLGYHYLEIQMLENKGRKYEPGASHHRNDTSYGGPLLTVILKPQAQSNVLRRRKPIFVKPEQATTLLMNPRLMSYMGFESGLLMPLVNQGKPNGLLKLFSQDQGRYAPEDSALYEELGRVLARTIENVRLHGTLRRMATVDSLTNLYTRRFFIEQLSREFKRARRYKGSLSLLMADIDHFKMYNDTFGHLHGDNVLVMVANVFRSCVREVDLVARYGGEEFVVLLPESNAKQGLVVAEKIRQAVRNHPQRQIERKAGFGPTTISIGVATIDDTVQNITDLINRADMALYKAKKEGRDRCIAA